MLSGAHVIIYSKDSERDREFFRDVLNLPSVDVGRGWLIFGLPPSEVAVHPAMKGGGKHELYLMVDDIQDFSREMRVRRVSISNVQDQGWGLVANITLPGGSALAVYQPRHERPASASQDKSRKKKVAPKKSAPKQKTAVKKAVAKKATARKTPTKPARAQTARRRSPRK